MNLRGIPPAASPNVTIRVSGKLFQGHLAYLDQLIQSAIDCKLWAILDLEHLDDLDDTALSFLVDGEGRDFGIVSCPSFVREGINQERKRAAA